MPSSPCWSAASAQSDGVCSRPARAFQARIDAGENPAFRPETKAIRNAEWTIADTPADLADRRVEITGPVDRKMIINALNSGASCFMADFEDSAAPTFEAMIAGQVNLRDAARRTIGMTDPNTGKTYALGDETATLIVRPRGWHLEEAHLLIDGQPVSASLFDFGLFFFHNAAALRGNGAGPYFYLPKMEHYEEAALWNAVFVAAQEKLGLPVGTIKATVLIETITAAFEMDEILHALKDHIVGLNCGRWDYIFSVIKTFRNRADCVLPDRGLVTMTQPFMRAYSRLLIKTWPPARRARDGRHGSADPHQRRRRSERTGVRQGARGQGARGRRWPRRHLGCPSGPRAGRPRGLRPDDAGG